MDRNKDEDVKPQSFFYNPHTISPAQFLSLSKLSPVELEFLNAEAKQLEIPEYWL